MRYDFLEGEIEHVSPDAIMDEARGLVYPAKVRITGSTLRTERLGVESNASALEIRRSNTSARPGSSSVLNSGAIGLEQGQCETEGLRDQTDNCPSRGRRVAGEQTTETVPAGAGSLRRGAGVEHTDSIQDMNANITLIQPGMSVTAEVKTGERSVASYLLSPIAKAVNESGRER